MQAEMGRTRQTVSSDKDDSAGSQMTTRMGKIYLLNGVARVRVDAAVLSHPRDGALQVPLLAEAVQVELQARVVAERHEADPDVTFAESEERHDVAHEVKLALEVRRPDAVRRVEHEHDVRRLASACRCYNMTRLH